MAFVEFIVALFEFDFGFIIEAAMNNIFWVFGFIAAGYFFSDKKSFFLFGMIYMSLILFTMDIFSMIGFTVYTATGLMFLYLARLSVLTFLESSKNLNHLIPLGYVLAFFLTLFVAALGWV
ncbi:MAG: hypothetical protein NUV67_00880 [archaeon]|nr:hypothetical protein [archaeon]